MVLFRRLLEENQDGKGKSGLFWKGAGPARLVRGGAEVFFLQ